MQAIKVISLNPDNKTAVVDVLGQQREVRAYFSDEYVLIQDLAVRIGQTGVKVWRGDATYWPSTGVVNHLRASQRDRMNQRGIRLVGFWADVSDAAKSRA